MDIETAAKQLGIPTTEISTVVDTPAGDVIATFDGALYVVVPDDQPDADGRTGVMFFKAPTSAYVGTFPVFTQPGAGDSDLDDTVAKAVLDADQNPDVKPPPPDVLSEPPLVTDPGPGQPTAAPGGSVQQLPVGPTPAEVVQAAKDNRTAATPGAPSDPATAETAPSGAGTATSTTGGTPTGAANPVNPADSGPSVPVKGTKST